MDRIVECATRLRKNHRRLLLELSRKIRTRDCHLSQLHQPITDISAVAKEHRRLSKAVRDVERRIEEAIIEWLELLAKHERHLRDSGFFRQTPSVDETPVVGECREGGALSAGVQGVSL